MNARPTSLILITVDCLRADLFQLRVAGTSAVVNALEECVLFGAVDARG